MDKCYGVCLTECIVIDEFQNEEQLQIADLVQVVYRDENLGKYSIKLLSNGEPIKKLIYTCDHSNIRIVSNALMPYLMGADYWGKLDILRFSKKILKLRRGSKVTLPIIDNQRKHFIQFNINFIGEIIQCGIGHFLGLNIIDDDDKHGPIEIQQKLFTCYNQNNDSAHIGFIVLRVEELFSEIELPEIKIPEKNPDNWKKDYNHDDIKIQDRENVLEDKNHPEHDNCPETMDVTNCSMPSPTFNPGLDNYGNVTNVLKISSDKRCGQCNSLHSLFTFPCSHALCYKCVLKQLDNIRKGSETTCPMCSTNLEKYDLYKFNKFVNINIEENSSSHEKKLPLDNASVGTYQYESQTKPKSEWGLTKVLNYFNPKKSEKPVQDYSAWRTSEHTTAEKNLNLLKELDREKDGLGVGERQCFLCKTRLDLFSFPCGHAFCVTCILRKLDTIQFSGIRCPCCFEVLKVTDEELFNKFVDNKMSSMAVKTPNKKHAEDNQTRNSKQHAEYPKKKGTGNKIEIRRCKSCHTDNRYSAISCVQCSRSLPKETIIRDA